MILLTSIWPRKSREKTTPLESDSNFFLASVLTIVGIDLKALAASWLLLSTVSVRQEFQR